MGNHDIWSYNNTGGSYEEPYPTGDAKFAKTFADRFAFPNLTGASMVYNNKTCYNPNHNITSWFQNWVLSYNGWVFMGLDWTSRTHAFTPLGYKGAWPGILSLSLSFFSLIFISILFFSGASSQNFPGGTLPWLQEQLKALPRATTKQVILFQHHPLAMPFFIPEAIYSFPPSDKDAIRQVIEDYGNGLNIWGVVAGHLHIWFSGMGFSASPNLPNFRQWLTEATKLGSSITLVNVDQSTNQIARISKLYGLDY